MRSQRIMARIAKAGYKSRRRNKRYSVQKKTGNFMMRKHNNKTYFKSKRYAKR